MPLPFSTLRAQLAEATQGQFWELLIANRYISLSKDYDHLDSHQLVRIYQDIQGQVNSGLLTEGRIFQFCLGQRIASYRYDFPVIKGEVGIAEWAREGWERADDELDSPPPRHDQPLLSLPPQEVATTYSEGEEEERPILRSQQLTPIEYTARRISQKLLNWGIIEAKDLADITEEQNIAIGRNLMEGEWNQIVRNSEVDAGMLENVALLIKQAFDSAKEAALQECPRIPSRRPPDIPPPPQHRPPSPPTRKKGNWTEGLKGTPWWEVEKTRANDGRNK